MIDYEQLVTKFLKSYIVGNQFQSATVIAPGDRWAASALELKRYVTVDDVYDKDPQLQMSYTQADAIFDDIQINSDVIVTFHGEKLYPPTRVFNGHHFLIVRESDTHQNCTNLGSMDYELSFLEMNMFGPFAVFTGEVTNVEPIRVPMYTDLRDRSNDASM